MITRHWFFLFLLPAPLGVQAAEPLGEMFWEPGMLQVETAGSVTGERYLLPGVPLDGKADPTGLTTAILDSGIDRSHPQIGGYIVEVKDFTGEGEDDVWGHGTAVAIKWLQDIRQNKRLLVDNLSGELKYEPGGLLIGKVVNWDKGIRKQTLMDAIAWAASRGASVINLSLGWKWEGSAKEFEDLCTLMAQTGVYFTVAAGNYGLDATVFPAACNLPKSLVSAALDETGKRLASSGKGNIAAKAPVYFVKEWEYWKLEGDHLLTNQKAMEARQSYEKSIRITPNPDAYLELGGMDMTEGRLDDAISRFRMAIGVDPEFAEAYLELGAALTRKGNYTDIEEATKWFQEASERGVTSPKLRDRYARALLDLGKPEEAKVLLDAIPKTYPRYTDIQELSLVAHNWITLRNAKREGIPLEVHWPTIIENNAVNTARFIIMEEANVNDVIASDGHTPITVSAYYGRAKIARLLLESGAETNSRTHEHGYTALMIAANRGHALIVKRLVEYGANIDAVDHTGTSALMAASAAGNIDVVKQLLDAGADTTLVSIDNLTAAGYADKFGHREIQMLILQWEKRRQSRK